VNHRRDIDGLRAIAVSGVILAHAGFGFVPAGHAGVDVFFVISGFLIGGIVAAELDAGKFSFRAFYARRARRILPALLVMLALTIPMGLFLMTPEQLRYFGGGALAAVLFLSNVWFFNRIDYFNPGAAEDPLIHTWSLGVEEQFYFVVPLLMAGLFRFGKGLAFAVIAALATASFALVLKTAPEQPMAAFYLLHTRAWELLVGVMAALSADRLRTFARPPLQEILPPAGLAAIVGGMALIPADAMWPGPLTLIPVLGTVVILAFATPDGPTARVLGVPVLVGIGLVSYSAYLWHQPILGFLKIAGAAPATSAAKAMAVAATLLIAWASWRWVEQPFRARSIPSLTARVILGALAAFVAIAAVGGHLTGGYPGRMPAAVLAMLDYTKAWPPTYRTCIGGRDEGERLDPAAACVHGADVPARIAVWGDSHAAVLAQPLGVELARHGLAVRELTVGSCIPIRGLKNSALKRTEYCAVHNAKMLDYLVESPEIEVVVLNAFWNSYTERRDFDTRAGWVQTDSVIALPLAADPSIDDEDRLGFIRTALSEEIGALTAAGKDVLILAPLPEAGFSPPEEMARRLWRDGIAPSELGFPAGAFDDYSRLSRDLLNSVRGRERVRILDLSDRFCTAGGLCRVVEDGVPLLFNENHLSLAGTAKVVPPLADAVLEILSRRVVSGD